jgi:hypothetical protein
MADKSLGGGPAFPRVANGGSGYWSEMEGISVRDYFAAAAMTALANRNNYVATDVATNSYALADAMMAERAKP